MYERLNRLTDQLFEVEKKTNKYRPISRMINKSYFRSLEYIIEDPSLLKEIQPTKDSTSSESASDDDHQSSKHKFAQIKAKFEKKALTNVMASPSSSSVASSQTGPRRNSNDAMSNPYRTNYNPASNRTHTTSSSNTSFRRLNSAEEADEEVQRIQGHGNTFRQQYSNTLTPISSMNETISQAPPPSGSHVQYEVVDEDGNPMAIDGVHDLIKMAGVTAREVKQADGSLVREYVIDDPTILSKFQSRTNQEHIPPPPPRVPLKQSMLFRPEPLANNQPPPINLQQIRTIEPQRRYEFLTNSGKRIEFVITSLGVDDSDVHQLANEINNRVSTSSSTPQAPAFTHPKQWQPAVDLTQRDPSSNRTQTMPENPPFQPGINDLSRSGSFGAMNMPNAFQQQFPPVFAEPIIDWSAVRQQDPHGQIDPQLIQQLIAQKHQSGAFQTSAQFLPEQVPRTSPSHQTHAYPYQGAQQHGVRILPQTTTDYNPHHPQHQTGHTRI